MGTPNSWFACCAGWHIAHAALRTDMRLLVDALAALQRSLDIQKPLLSWQVIEVAACFTAGLCNTHTGTASNLVMIMSSFVVYGVRAVLLICCDLDRPHQRRERKLAEKLGTMFALMAPLIPENVGERSEGLLVAVQ